MTNGYPLFLSLAFLLGVALGWRIGVGYAAKSIFGRLRDLDRETREKIARRMGVEI